MKPVSDLTPEDVLREPSYEKELATAAMFLRNKAQLQSSLGIPVIAVMISPEFALRISGWLDAYATEFEEHGG